jgi:hypothetical protein
MGVSLLVKLSSVCYREWGGDEGKTLNERDFADISNFCDHTYILCDHKIDKSIIVRAKTAAASLFGQKLR